MLCNNCGKEIADNSKFCMYCGVQLSDNENIKDNTQSSKDEIRVVLDQVNVKIDKDNSHLSSISDNSKAFRKKWGRIIKRTFYALAVIVLFFAAIVIGTEIYEEIDYNIKCKQKQELAQANTLKRMVLVEGGSFDMGEGSISLKNSHKVELSDYYIGIYEVTQGEFNKYDDRIPAEDRESTKPVVNISWYECVEYCNHRSEEEGLEQCYLIYGTIVELLPNKNGYRLPTEAEWEYAAKGGKLSQGYVFSGSDELSEVAWYGEEKDRIYYAGTKQPNELGIYDMSGNVWEWCYDGYSQYSTKKQTNPLVEKTLKLTHLRRFKLTH